MAANNSDKYEWAKRGDINAFFGLMLDNVTNLVFLAGILIITFNFPPEIIYNKMFPGTAFGVLVGDLVYTWLAFRLAKRTGSKSVTAMPLGLDAPSTIGIALSVIGPAFLIAKGKGLSPNDAGIIAWQVGMATLLIIGLIKLVLSFVGEYVEKIIPEAGLLGSLTGIGVALLGLLPFVHTFSSPIVGLISLGIILYALVAKIKIPYNIPSVMLAVGAGTIIYYFLVIAGLAHGPQIGTSGAEQGPLFRFALPLPTLSFLGGMKEALNYLPVAIPFGLLTVIGGINVTASARLAGDSYSTRSILLTEAVATIAAAICGGVSQSTPYIGQPAYKAMGGRAAYTLATGLFIGLGGIFGYISLMAEIIPQAALAPILIFVGLDIVEQSYHATPKRHASAVTLAILPSVAELVRIQMAGLIVEFHIVFKKLQEKAPELADTLTKTLDTLKPKFAESWITINALGHGFILTAMMWGAITAKLIDRDFTRAIQYLIATATLSFFGVIHSIREDGGIYFPWEIPYSSNGPHPYTITSAYLCLAVLFYVMGKTKSAKETAME